MTKYSPKAQKVIEKAMEDYKNGSLQIGHSDKKVTRRDQAIAIGISEARKKGFKTPSQHEEN